MVETIKVEDVALPRILVMKERETVMDLVMEVPMMDMLVVKESLYVAAIIARSLEHSIMKKTTAVRNHLPLPLIRSNPFSTREISLNLQLVRIQKQLHLYYLKNFSGQRCSGRNYQGRRCCTPENPCDEGEGDCDGPGDGGGHDGHAACKGELVCGSNNCKQFGAYYHEKDDCCEKPSTFG